MFWGFICQAIAMSVNNPDDAEAKKEAEQLRQSMK